MDNNQFNLKPFNERAKYTWRKGKYLACRVKTNFVINLYSVDNFYVETWINPDKISFNKIRSFKTRRGLEPYLKKITIDF